MGTGNMIRRLLSYLKRPKLFQRLWKKFLSLFYFEQWSLLVSKANDDAPFSWDNFKLLVPPKDYFWADPFPWQVNGEDYIFYEELPYSTNKGYISCMKLGGSLEILSNEVVLERPYHLSYPFLFEYERHLYMLPETRQNRTIEIYRCERFPNKWEKAGALIANIEAVDATLLEFNDKWWLFTNVVKPGGNAYDSLYLYHSDSPISDKWTPHPHNPVILDIKYARPAGRIFKQDEYLIRPSQDCSARYGYAINFNRIDQLSETDYKETPLTHFAPPKGNLKILSTHTWNKSGNLHTIDAEYWRRR